MLPAEIRQRFGLGSSQRLEWMASGVGLALGEPVGGMQQLQRS